IWEEFCDWYIEMVKPRLYGTDAESKVAALWTLNSVLKDSLKLLHPYMPFVTEEIFCILNEAQGLDKKYESIMISEWPVFSENRVFAETEDAVELIKEAVKGIRNVRTGMNVPPSRKAKLFVVTENDRVKKIFENSGEFLATLASASAVTLQSDRTGIDDDAVSTVVHGAVIYMPFADLVDIDKEIERLEKEQKRLEGEIKRSNGMLSNPGFVSKAPESKLAEEREKLAKYTDMLKTVTERLEHFKK
ncbi:MAG: class I tRNA ligase family protein, partial [Lachnospiraceae bacterium]|nr:class I tRNA ligase family protein [Lachnospiraceae bacterium]